MDEKQKYTLSTMIALAIATTLLIFGLAIKQGTTGDIENLISTIMLVLAAIIIIIEYIMFKVLLLKKR